MPKRPKSGPPYTDIPEEVYVVVTNPWGMDSNPRSRAQGDFNRIASWAQFVLQQSGLYGGRVPTIECIYGMGTRDEIILQFEEGTDIIPLLGEHRWANFWKHCPDPNDPQSTCVFLYNWRNNGDPANHNWTENFPENLPLDTIPAKSPYPAPSWTSPPSTLVNLVIPIPRPAIPPPIPNHVDNADQEQQSPTLPPPSMVTPSPAPPQQSDQPESGEQSAERDSASTSLFKPYKPPSQYPSHAQLLNHPQKRGEEAPSSKASQKFIKKLDPYELEEDALNIIRSSTPEQEDKKEPKIEDLKPTLHTVKVEISGVKTEENNTQHNIASRSGTGYQPSQALIDAFNTLHPLGQLPASAPPPARDPRGPDTTSKIIPPASSGYQPSAELEGEINALLRYRTTGSSSSSNDGRPTISARIAVKRECEDDTHTFRERKKIKIEQD